MDGLEVIYDSLVYFKIMHWVEKAGTNEISGFGKVILKDGKLRVVDAMLLPQRNGAAHTDIEPEDLGKAEFLLKDTPGELRLWWHSHVKMGCFWSTTDTDTIKLLGKHGWILATVFNQKWEKRSALYDGINQFFFDDLATRHVMAVPTEMSKPWDEEFEKNVKLTHYAHGGGIYEGYWRQMMNKKMEEGEYKMRKFQVNKHERHLIISAPKDNRLFAILETKSYGKVLWYEEDNKMYGKFLTKKDKPDLQIFTKRYDLWEDIIRIKWANADYMDDVFKLAESFKEIPRLLAASGFKKKKSNVIHLPGGKGQDPTKGETKFSPVGPTDETMRKEVKGWDTLSEDDKELQRVLYEDRVERQSTIDAYLRGDYGGYPI